MNSNTKIQEWSPNEVQTKAAQCELIDVRGADEYQGPLSHIASAKLITLGANLDTFLRDHAEELKDKTIVFICRSGARSMRAAEHARSLGYNKLVNMSGGMIAWNELKLPVANHGA